MARDSGLATASQALAREREREREEREIRTQAFPTTLTCQARTVCLRTEELMNNTRPFNATGTNHHLRTKADLRRTKDSRGILDMDLMLMHHSCQQDCMAPEGLRLLSHE